jgi:hypothetical protein
MMWLMGLVWGFGSQAVSVKQNLLSNVSLFGLKGAVSSSRPSPEARLRGAERSTLAEGHRRKAARSGVDGREHGATLARAGSAFAACFHRSDWIENEPRGARHGARGLAPRPCIRLGPVGPRP